MRRKPECKRCKATDRNRIVKAEGCEASWHMAAKPTGTQPTVNAALVHRQFALLPGEICRASGGGIDSKTRIGSPRATKNQAPWRAARCVSKKEAATCQHPTARRVETRGVTEQKSAKAIVGGQVALQLLDRR